jgi:hypothetical protein
MGRHDMLYPVIADSGANHHMFRDKAFFHTLTPATGTVILGDGKTSVSIEGVGTVHCRIGSYNLTIPNVRYVPGLSESIYSLFLHVQTPQHGLESSYDQGLFLQFPQFKTKALIGENDIYLDMVPLDAINTDQQSSSKFITLDDSPFCHNIMQLNDEIQNETKNLDNIMRDLCQYYDRVKTKRQLGLTFLLVSVEIHLYNNNFVNLHQLVERHCYT